MRLFLLGVVLTYLLFFALALFSGGMLARLTVEPAQALDYLVFRAKLEQTRFPEWFFFPEKTDRKDAFLHDRAKMSGGLTFFSSADKNTAQLIDVNGEIIHEWDADYFRIWPHPAHIGSPVPAQHITLYRAFLDPALNGDVYVMFYGNGDPYSRYGLAKLDKNSRVLWRYEGAAHHDLAFLPGGRLLTFAEGNLRPGEDVLDEFLVTLDPDGREVRRVSLIEALRASGAGRFLETVRAEPQDKNMSAGDCLHPNTITPVTAAVAGKAPMLKEGRVLLSFRNLDMLAVMDVESGVVEWTGFGPWKGQHSPRFTSEGHVVMFDNFGDLNGGGSRIIEVDLNDDSIVWSYEGTPEDPFFSPYNGMVELLPGGNMLVTETHSGRIFEVTRGGEVVWEYYAPYRFYYKGGVVPVFDPDAPRIPSLFSGARYKAGDLSFLASDSKVLSQP